MFFGEDLRESGLRSKARSESAAQSSRVKAQHHALMRCERVVVLSVTFSLR